MSHTLRRLALLSFAVLGAGRASAEMVDYSYQWSTSSGGIVVGTNATTGNGLSTGSVAFALFADGTASAESGGGPSVIPAASVSTTGSASDAAPDVFASPFDLTLRLTDAASGEFGDLTFTGTVNGSLTATASSLTADLDGPLTRALTLGAFVYEVTIDPASVSVPAPVSPPALLGAFVRVSELRPDVPVTQTPEPAGLLLAGVGLSLTALSAARSRLARRRAAGVA